MRLLDPGQSKQDVTSVLCEAFADYPVMRYLLGESGDYDERLGTLIGFFVAARVLRRDAILVLSNGSDVGGVALRTMPDTAHLPSWSGSWGHPSQTSVAGSP